MEKSTKEPSNDSTNLKTLHPETKQYIRALKSENLKLQKRIGKLEAEKVTLQNRIKILESESLKQGQDPLIIQVVKPNGVE